MNGGACVEIQNCRTPFTTGVRVKAHAGNTIEDPAVHSLEFNTGKDNHFTHIAPNFAFLTNAWDERSSFQK